MPAGDNDGLSPQEKGGAARAKALGPVKRSEIASKAALARWSVPKATHEGPLQIGGTEIACAVLEDGTRVLSRAGFIRAIGRTGKAKGGRKYDLEFEVPVFLTADNLKPFIPNDLLENSKPVTFRTTAGMASIGYRADLLPQVCHVFMDAKEAGALRANQIHIADKCKLLSRGFSILGLTALIDEATGYQEVRDRLALQKILDAYLSHELAAWAKRFPDEFYREIFRLRDWKRNKVGQRMPKLVGKLTKDVVYQRLAPELVKELERKNPKDEKGNRRAKHHQWLTADVGHPALAQHLHTTIALMRAVDTWAEFKALLDKALPRRTKIDDLPLFKTQ